MSQSLIHDRRRVSGLIVAVVAVVCPAVLRAEQPLLAFEAVVELEMQPVQPVEGLVEAQVVPVPAAVPAVRLQAPQVEAAAVEAAQRDARILGWVLERGLEALAAPANGPAGIVLDRQRQAQIDQQAQQMERFFQPMLASELELIRRFCDHLAPAARRKLVAAGRKAVKTTAKEYATRQLTGRLGQDEYDPREEIRRPLSELLEELADPAAYAAYSAEQAARAARRTEAARVMIVTKLDRLLDLTSAQRGAIEADLEEKWQPDWLRSLSEHAGLINGYPLAPDYAAACIAPHLRPEQATIWRAWSQAAGERLIGRQSGFSLDNQGLQTIDAWWGGPEE